MKHSFRKIYSFTLLLSLILATQSVRTFACDDCVEIDEQREQLEKSVLRLKRIKGINESFIATLGSNDDSERMKASSNIRLANKRIQENEEKLNAVQLQLNNTRCRNCLKKPPETEMGKK